MSKGTLFFVCALFCIAVKFFQRTMGYGYSTPENTIVSSQEINNDGMNRVEIINFPNL